jgi:ADP-ribose diphosphatase
MSRFGFVHHPESVALVVVDGTEIVLVRQTRPGAGSTTLEIPGGTVEHGETPEQTAVRELSEECRLAASNWRRVGGFWVVPAYSTEYAHVFEATGLSPSEDGVPDEDEDIVLERLPAEAAFREVSDAGSIAALALWLEQRRAGLPLDA